MLAQRSRDSKKPMDSACPPFTAITYPRRGRGDSQARGRISCLAVMHHCSAGTDCSRPAPTPSIHIHIETHVAVHRNKGAKNRALSAVVSRTNGLLYSDELQRLRPSASDRLHRTILAGQPNCACRLAQTIFIR